MLPRKLSVGGKLFLVPLLGIICIIALTHLFNSVAVEQKKLLDQFSQAELSKLEELRAFYAEFAGNHISLFDLLARASAGGDEGRLYDHGIILLDRLRDSSTRFDEFSTIHPLSDDERAIYQALQEELASYYEASRLGIEMATVDLSLSDSSIRSANKHFKGVDRKFSSLTAAMHKNTRQSFSDLQTSTDQRLTTFFGVMLAVLALLSAASLISAIALKKLKISLEALREEQRNSEIIITERIEAEQRFEFLASHDTLTNLPNRVLLLDSLEQCLVRATHYAEKVAVLFLDLDQFKIVNDSLGHTVGDELIKNLAIRLSGCVRKHDLIARPGGDEFVIVLNGIAKEADIGRAINRIFNALKEPFYLGRSSYTATASIGISLYPDDARDAQSLLRQADTAMYKAKSRGRNQYQFYTAEMNRNAAEQFELEAALRRALENDEFELYYQPKVSIATGEIAGAEALIRWNRPAQGIVPPGKFLHTASESGLIVPIGNWVLKTACAQLSAWHARLPAKISVAVNIDDKQFQQPDLVSDIARALRASQLDPQYLEIELTENILMDNVNNVMEKLQALKNLGVALSIDDFGTGYSSYSQLKHFGINTLKIDRSFITGLPGNADDCAIVSAVIAMSKNLKLSIVAEGVETPAQFNFLRKAGCDLIQGYLFSKPLPAPAFAALLNGGGLAASASELG